MLLISSDTPVNAWRECLKKLYNNQYITDNKKFYRDEVAVIEIKQPCIEQVPAEFPMSQQDINTINDYIVTGDNESAVVHEWTKLYYHRIFDEPKSQYDFLINKLREDPQSGRSQIVLWDKLIDQDAEIAPCTQVIWARQKFKKLELHVHAASVDAYKKLLMNQQEFISLQIHIANQLGISVGKFYHVIDSCHLYHKDIDKIEGILNVDK